MARVEIVSSIEELARYETAWNELLLFTDIELPMLSYEWVVSHLEHRLNVDQDWLCVLVHDEDGLVAVLPLVISTKQIIGRKYKFATPPYLADFLIKPGREGEILPLMVDHLIDSLPGLFVIDINDVDELSSLAIYSDLNRTDNFYKVRTSNRRCSILKTVGSHSEYENSLSKNFKRVLKRAEKKLGKLSNVRTEIIFPSDDHNNYLDEFLKLEDSGWKGKEGGNAISLSPERIAMKRAMVKRLSSKGSIGWQFLYAEGNLIAAQMSVKFGSGLTIPKIAYDEDYSRYSPGSVILRETIKYAFQDDEIVRINLLTDMDWHNSWNVSKRDISHVYIFPRRVVPFVFGYLPRKILTVLKGEGENGN